MRAASEHCVASLCDMSHEFSRLEFGKWMFVFWVFALPWTVIVVCFFLVHSISLRREHFRAILWCELLDQYLAKMMDIVRGSASNCCTIVNCVLHWTVFELSDLFLLELVVNF